MAEDNLEQAINRWIAAAKNAFEVLPENLQSQVLEVHKEIKAMETYTEQREREYNTITPAPWRWVFLGNAGNYFLLGNDGEGPVTNSGPDSADGKLKQAAPELLAALRLAYSLGPRAWRRADHPIGQRIRAALAKVEGNDANQI